LNGEEKCLDLGEELGNKRDPIPINFIKAPENLDI